jgi:hypothetical protein
VGSGKADRPSQPGRSGTKLRHAIPRAVIQVCPDRYDERSVWSVAAPPSPRGPTRPARRTGDLACQPSPTAPRSKPATATKNRPILFVGPGTGVIAQDPLTNVSAPVVTPPEASPDLVFRIPRSLSVILAFGLVWMVTKSAYHPFR